MAVQIENVRFTFFIWAARGVRGFPHKRKPLTLSQGCGDEVRASSHFEIVADADYLTNESFQSQIHVIELIRFLTAFSN